MELWRTIYFLYKVFPDSLLKPLPSSHQIIINPPPNKQFSEMATKIPSPPHQQADIQITVHPSDPKPSPLQQHPLFTKWSPWLVPLFIFANIIMFIITMFFNNCPKNSSSCVGAHFLGRLSFQPLKENPLLGPSASM